MASAPIKTGSKFISLSVSSGVKTVELSESARCNDCLRLAALFRSGDLEVIAALMNCLKAFSLFKVR